MRTTAEVLEGFSEEILNILEWMRVRQRSVVPMDFTVETMRPWDSFFWWMEMPALHADRPQNMFDPVDFPAKGAARPITVESRIYRATNTVVVETKPKVANVLVSLSPDIIDFRTKATVKVNGKVVSPPDGMIAPSIETMLSDVHTRGDRLHPFWAILDGR